LRTVADGLRASTMRAVGGRLGTVVLSLPSPRNQLELKHNPPLRTVRTVASRMTATPNGLTSHDGRPGAPTGALLRRQDAPQSR
jgi:hypothetical protein